MGGCRVLRLRPNADDAPLCADIMLDASDAESNPLTSDPAWDPASDTNRLGFLRTDLPAPPRALAACRPSFFCTRVRSLGGDGVGAVGVSGYHRC